MQNNPWTKNFSEQGSGYSCISLVGRTGPTGPVGPSGAAGPTGPTGPEGVFSAAYAGVVTVNTQTVADRAAIQFAPPFTEISNVAFNGSNLFTILVPGNYFCIGYIAPAADQEGPVTVVIGFNGPDYGLYGSNYGLAAGQQVVCFGFTGYLPAGSTLGLYNASGRAITLGPIPARLALFRVS